MKKALAGLALFAAGSALAAGIVWTAFPPEFALESLLDWQRQRGLVDQPPFG